MNKTTIFILLSLFLSSSIHTTILGQDAYSLTKNMFAATQKIESMTYTMRKQERIGDELPTQITSVKMITSPLQVYLHQDAPKKGMEVLYVAERSKKALINPNGFPWINISLDPYGSQMRKNQHHTIHNAGLYHVISILEYLFDKYGEDIKPMVELLEPTIWDGQECNVVMLQNSNYKHISHTVKKGETVLTIADSLKLSEYMILEINEDVDDYEDVSTGQVISIPSEYSPKMIIYIDKKREIPLVMKVYDEKGIYENYEYTNVILNPTFEEKEFSKYYKEYGF